MFERKLSEFELEQLLKIKKRYHPSPEAWEDQILYFLLLDRFSDGKEFGYWDNDGNLVTRDEKHTTPLLTEENKGNILNDYSHEKWRNAGGRWVGGNLKGLSSKIGYLKRLGITSIWISPLFKQVSFQESYHGYGIQNYLEVDPHFGTREDLQELVEIAHENNIYIVLDIILNHTGDIFSYTNDCASWNGNKYNVKGFRNKKGEPVLPFVKSISEDDIPDTDDAVWPYEFQDPENFTQKGYINNWDYDPEYLEGDFFSLKDIQLGRGNLEYYVPSNALNYLCEVYKFWIAYADIDGFRIDTVKHMDMGATRFFTTTIHEFTQRIGKTNFYMLGEITGGRNNAFETLEHTGIDAALGIDEVQSKMENVVKGYEDAQSYFNLFRNPFQICKDSHTWLKNKVVTMFNDHDQVCKGNYKARFCAQGENSRKFLLNAMALNITTLGIPCLYYGTEQGLDGEGDNDRYIREAMFGGEFGAFRSKGFHVFNEDTYEYKEISKIIGIERAEIALRKGRQYLREISGNKVDFSFPHIIGQEMRSIVPWSRVFDNIEILVAMNTDCNQELTAWVTIDNVLNNNGDYFYCIYSTENKDMEEKRIRVEQLEGGRVIVPLSVPAHGFVIYKNTKNKNKFSV